MVNNMFLRKKKIVNAPIPIGVFRPESALDSAEPYYTKTLKETGVRDGCFVPRRPKPPRLSGSLITGITPFNRMAKSIRPIAEFIDSPQTQGCFLFKDPNKLRATIDMLEPVLASYLNNGKNELANHLFRLHESITRLEQHIAKKTDIPFSKQLYRMCADSMTLLGKGYIPSLTPPSEE